MFPSACKGLKRGGRKEKKGRSKRGKKQYTSTGRKANIRKTTKEAESWENSKSLQRKAPKVNPKKGGTKKKSGKGPGGFSKRRRRTVHLTLEGGGTEVKRGR